MAEFESGYCTGCGVKARVWGHRPYCWRDIGNMSGAGKRYMNEQRIQSCLRKMHRFWRIRSIFLVKKEHMYFHLEKPHAPIRELVMRSLRRMKL